MRGIASNEPKKAQANDDTSVTIASSQNMQQNISIDEKYKDYDISVKMELKEEHRDGKIDSHRDLVREISLPGNGYVYVMHEGHNNGECFLEYGLKNKATGEMTDLPFLKNNLNQRSMNPIDSPEGQQAALDTGLLLGMSGVSPEAVAAAKELIDITVEYNHAEYHENIKVNSQTNVETRNTVMNKMKTNNGNEGMQFLFFS